MTSQDMQDNEVCCYIVYPCTMSLSSVSSAPPSLGRTRGSFSFAAPSGQELLHCVEGVVVFLGDDPSFRLGVPLGTKLLEVFPDVEGGACSLAPKFLELYLESFCLRKSKHFKNNLALKSQETSSINANALFRSKPVRVMVFPSIFTTTFRRKAADAAGGPSISDLPFRSP